MSQSFTDNVYVGTNVVLNNLVLANNNFAALKSSFSGGNQPANTIAGMWWFDETSNTLKIRNKAGNAWLCIWDLANNKPVIANNVITGAMCVSALKDPAANIYGFRRLGTTGVKACAGNDSRLETIPNAYVSQVKLKTSQGSVFHSQPGDSAGGANYVLPGGEYGFYPETKKVGPSCSSNQKASIGDWTISSPGVYVTRIYLYVRAVGCIGGPFCNYAQQRYITASGEVHWIFILRDKITKIIISMYQAPDHPCFGNGGKPLLVVHPFEDYDETKHEIIVINPTNEEIEQMELETIVDDETKPDKDLLEVITENYKIDEASNPAWPSIPVTVGLPKHVTGKKGKKTLADYRFMSSDTVIEPIKKVIPKPDYVKVKKLRRK